MVQGDLPPATQEGLHTEQNNSHPSWVREFVLSIAEHIAAHCCNLGHQQRSISLWLCLFLVLSTAAATRLWHSWVHLQPGPAQPPRDTHTTQVLAMQHLQAFPENDAVQTSRAFTLSYFFFRGGDSCTITSQLRGHDVNYSNQDDLAAFQRLPWPGKAATPPCTRLILVLSPVSATLTLLAPR